MRSRSAFCAWFLLSIALNIDLTVAERKNWVLLVAGSKTWSNYRHQANVCHAYQIVHAHGIPDEQIVVMIYDDVAENKNNPYPGVIINQPDGPNVYSGVPKDYVGEEVNADVFLKVLQGDKEGIKDLLGRDGKVIDSGPEDYVFVSYTDHGGNGVVAMPAQPDLYADELNEVLKSMHAQKKFDKLVFYMEACHSGSMFDGLLPDDINIYGSSSSKPNECTYLAYWDDERGTYLSDEYSCSWMENSDEEDMSTYTLQQQQDYVVERVESSTPMQYGDVSWTSLPIGQFLSNGGKSAKMNSTRLDKAFPVTPISSDDLPIFTIQNLLAGPMGRKYGEELSRNLEEQLWLREKTQNIMEDIARVGLPELDSKWVVKNFVKINNWDCYRPAVESLFELCPRLRPSDNEYILQRLNVLVSMCNSRPKAVVMETVKKVARESSVCLS